MRSSRKATFGVSPQMFEEFSGATDPPQAVGGGPDPGAGQGPGAVRRFGAAQAGAAAGRSWMDASAAGAIT